MADSAIARARSFLFVPASRPERANWLPCDSRWSRPRAGRNCRRQWDGVTTDTGNRERQLLDAQRARAFGFGAKLCIHPAQVTPVNETFSPSESELAWASRVVEGARSHKGQAFSLNGRMVDLPVIRLAEQILGQAPV